MALLASQSLHLSARCSSPVCFQKEATESHLFTVGLESDPTPSIPPNPEGNNKSRPGIFSGHPHYPDDFWPKTLFVLEDGLPPFRAP